MQLLPTLDTVLYNVQRQGKISFYVSLVRSWSCLIYLVNQLDDFSESCLNNS